jgi:hypothetical protein
MRPVRTAEGHKDSRRLRPKRLGGELLALQFPVSSQQRVYTPGGDPAGAPTAPGSSCCGRRQSSGHSAHIGPEVEVHYRWHPLYGRRVRQHRSEQRLAGRYVYLEAAPGVVTVVAAWMLDPVTCAAMAIGAPRVAVSALIDLHHLLIERGFRQSSLDDPNIVQEEQDEEPADVDTAVSGPAPAQHAVRFQKASGDEPLGAQDGARRARGPLVGGRRRRGGGA